jgi:DNA-binding beta-propeller fold protein YncE
MTTELAAFCIDLPAAARVDPSNPSSWGVATSGTDLYLANARTGWIGVIDYQQFKLLRSTSLGAEASTMSSPRPLAVSADGSTLYLARPSGVVPVASASLVAGKPLAQRAFGSLALGTDGSMLYASGGGTTMALDTHTGAASSTLATAGGLTLVGVAKAS